MTPEDGYTLSDSEYRRVWDRFDDAFQFRPSCYAVDWPTFREPAGSVTWSLRGLPDGEPYERLDRFDISSLGHPWEHSICLFGTDLLRSVSSGLDEILGSPIRVGGRPAGQP